MNETLLTISLLIIVACSLGILGLFITLYRTLRQFARDTDYDFRAIKTRMADEERVNQRELARNRDAKHKGMQS